ncbi:hypothetical protein AAC387_Pa10g2045 [Persea americana]
MVVVMQWGPANAALDEALDVDIGVAVEFEEDEEEEDSDYDLVQEEGDGPELNGNEAMQMGGGIDEDDAGVETNDGLMLNVQDIDAYWLQRKISQAYEKIDPQHCQKLAEDVLKILTEGGDDSDVENLLQLHTTRAARKESQKNLDKSIREEAKLLKDESGGDGDRDRRVVDREVENRWSEGRLQLLDLNSLAFGLLMANNKCELLQSSFWVNRKGCEEVHVPRLKPQPLAAGEELIKISVMPDWAQPAFEGMKQLNRVLGKQMLQC